MFMSARLESDRRYQNSKLHIWLKMYIDVVELDIETEN